MKNDPASSLILLAGLLYLFISLPLIWPQRPREGRDDLARFSYNTETERLVREGKIDINRAGTQDCEWLPGIGPHLARTIVETRELQGPFPDVPSLLRVRGIGPATLEAISPYLIDIKR